MVVVVVVVVSLGEFGVVYKAEYILTTEETGYEVSTVAVKTLKGETTTFKLFSTCARICIASRPCSQAFLSPHSLNFLSGYGWYEGKIRV